MKTCFPPHEIASHHEDDLGERPFYIEQPFDIPDSMPPFEDPDDSSDLDDPDSAPDDECWDVFLPDDDEYDLDPDHDDFWGSTDAADWDDDSE